MAAVVAEAVGGDEETFARMMTRKARVLGMSRTVYANASGLPDPDQITTARDQATLGRAIQDRFPREYRYFATPVFVYRGWAMRNHNKLLGRVQGLDGIKTGYTRNSGFNLVTSVRRGPRHIVAVVLGGTSGAARDARMRVLIEQQIASGSSQRTVAKIAESTEVAATQAKPTVPLPSMARLARADTMAPITTNNVAEGDTGPAHVAPAIHAAPPVALFAVTSAEAWLCRADQSREGEDHHGEGRQCADRDAGADIAGADRDGRPAAFRQECAGRCSGCANRGGEAGCPRGLSGGLGELCPGHHGLGRAASSASARPVAHSGRSLPEGSRGA